MDKISISRQVSCLSNYLRRHAEDFCSFGSLLCHDRHEAIDNFERSFESCLIAFHSVYDISKDDFKYFDHPDTTLIIAVRNALVHRRHGLFEGFLSRIWLRGGFSEFSGSSFLLVSHCSSGFCDNKHASRFVPRYYIKLDDIFLRFDPDSGSDCLDSSVGKAVVSDRFRILNDGLFLSFVRDFSRKNRYPDSHVFVDLFPVFVSAISRVFCWIKDYGVGLEGFDSSVYSDFFGKDFYLDAGVVMVSRYNLNEVQECLGPQGIFLPHQEILNLREMKGL
ncbi:MAG: hypothetical protein Q4D19_10625 [Lautropia sp.]|nr:hypothetical protein [Lautropia sp.]